MDLFNHIKALEQSLHHSSLRSDQQKAASLLHPQFREFGCSGREFDKSSILQLMAEENFNQKTVHSLDYQYHMLGEDLVQLTYKSVVEDADGQLAGFSIRCSLWQKLDGNWLLRFHQGTPTSSFSLCD